jgi:hypothetical protein
VVAIGLGAIIFSFYISRKRTRRLYESYVLTISDSAITREQYQTPTVTISNSDINVIIKNNNGSFTIKGGTAQDLIGIPTQIETTISSKLRLASSTLSL